MCLLFSLTSILRATQHWNVIGMPYVGAYHSKEDREQIRTMQKNGIIFAFFAYSYGTNGIPVPLPNHI
ncbi:CapA family protein [Bacillus toyonensis]|uniref:CapA family protein n=1 Tax=Bacillus toyonensis TaxID=155322 RepID=UPI00115F30D1